MDPLLLIPLWSAVARDGWSRGSPRNSSRPAPPFFSFPGDDAMTTTGRMHHIQGPAAARVFASRYTHDPVSDLSTEECGSFPRLSDAVEWVCGGDGCAVVDTYGGGTVTVSRAISQATPGRVSWVVRHDDDVVDVCATRSEARSIARHHAIEAQGAVAS